MTADEIVALMEICQHLRTINHILMLKWGMEFDDNGDVVLKDKERHD